MSPSSSRKRNVFEPLDGSFVADLWESRFGIPESIFSGYIFFQKAQSVWAANDAHLPELSYEAIGMRIMNLKDRPWKPTTNALQVFGRHARKNLINLDLADARSFLEGMTISLESEPASEPEPEPESEHESEPVPELESGYVVVFYRGEVLGCGLYSHGKLASQIPKERRLASAAQSEPGCSANLEENH